MINERAKAILYFCFKKTKMDKWFKKDEKFDNELKDLFMSDYYKAINNEYKQWQNNPEECVALVLILDQLSRNFFRNNSKAYDQDYKCRLIVNEAVDRGYLEELSQKKIHFLLMPLIHSEDISDHVFVHKLIDTYLKTFEHYGKGFILKPLNEDDPDWGEKYYRGGWWMPSQNGWFFKKKSDLEFTV